MATSFRDLASAFEKLETISSSLAMIDFLAAFLPKLSPEEVKITAYLLRGELAPPFSAQEFGIAQKMALRAVALAFDTPLSKVQKLFARTGDAGIVAAHLSEQGRH